MIALELQFGGKPLVKGGFEVHGSRITLVVVAFDDIIVTGVTQRRIVACLFRTARYAEGMLVRPGVLGQQIEPVGVHGFQFSHFLCELLVVDFSVVKFVQRSFVTHHVGIVTIPIMVVEKFSRERILSREFIKLIFRSV